MGGRRIVLLGPQRTQPGVRDAIGSAVGDDTRPVAAITAGWEEREAEIDELSEHLERRVINLGLFRRAEEIRAADPELHAAVRERDDRLREVREIYRLRLRHSSPVVRILLRRKGSGAVLEREREAAIESLRLLDAQHLDHSDAIVAEFVERWRPAERDAVARHRRELIEILGDVAALCVAGGHVGVLADRMRLLGFPELFGDLPLVAWSAGAMVLTERIVLFHDSPPQGKGNAEVFERGFGIAPGVVVFPHAGRRLRLDDAHRVAFLARRFQPALCATLDEGTRLDRDGAAWRLHEGTRRLTAAGQLEGAT